MRAAAASGLLSLLVTLALPTAAAGGEVRLGTGEMVTVESPGATAAFAVDAGIVEAAAGGGHVVLVGRRVGQTLVTVVAPTAVETLTVHVSVVADSVPPGYALGDLEPQVRRPAPGTPAVADFTARAHRVLAGRILGDGPGPVTVTALEVARTVAPDEEGRFLLGGLPAGPLTLVVRSPEGEARTVVELPPGPASVTGIELPAP